MPSGRAAEPLLALDDVTLTAAHGEFISLVGPSGCGKSTVLNLLAGLIRPSAGDVLYQGRPVRGINKRIGYITQDDNLLPWRSMLKNVEFGLELRGVARRERRERAREFIGLVGLGGFEDHYPHELSGGMRKRAKRPLERHQGRDRSRPCGRPAGRSGRTGRGKQVMSLLPAAPAAPLRTREAGS